MFCDNSERVTQRDPEAAVGEEVEGERDLLQEKEE